MKNIPIKFRGVSELTGKHVYGVGVKDYGDNRVDIITGGMVLEAVQADSIVQLVGYDIDDKEIYEDDVVTCDGVNTDVAVVRLMVARASFISDNFNLFKKYHAHLIEPKDESNS